MNTGMLWFDNDPKVDIRIKIQRASEYYQKKYGQNPNLVYVHPSMLPKEPVQNGRLEVKPNRAVLPDHFWIGMQPIG